MLEILLDPQDAHLWSLPWYVTNGGYIRRNFVDTQGRRRYELLHRLIVGAPAGAVVDHVNGNTLDNRRCNLRVCSQTENTLNRRMHRNNRLGVKGVYKSRNRFCAQIRVGGKKLNLGSYRTVEEAKSAYDAAAVRFHGEYARFA